MTATKNAPRKAKRTQEDKKKLMVRIVCWVMVAALVLTSGLAMMSWIFNDGDDGTMSAAELQAYIDAGLVVLGEDGNYYWNFTMDEDGTMTAGDESAEGEAQTGEETPAE